MNVNLGTGVPVFMGSLNFYDTGPRDYAGGAQHSPAVIEK